MELSLPLGHEGDPRQAADEVAALESALESVLESAGLDATTGATECTVTRKAAEAGQGPLSPTEGERRPFPARPTLPAPLGPPGPAQPSRLS